MSEPQLDMNVLFLAVAKELGAEPGDSGYYRGIIKHAPFLFKMTSTDPPGFVVKLRKMGGLMPKSAPVSRAPRSDWHDSLSSEYSGAGIRCDVEGDYVFIWIDQPQDLTAESIASLVGNYVRDHSQYFPTTDTCCYDCRNTGSASLVQSSSSIATICQECLGLRKRMNVAENERLNTSDARVSILLPLALLLGSFGWAVFWTIYDVVFRIANTGRIWAPFIVFALVIAAVGFGLGWPVGRVLHRSGVVKRLFHGWLSIFSALFIVVFGEMIYASYFVYSVTGTFEFSLVTQATLLSARGKDLHYISYRFIFAVAVAGAIYEFAKPRTVKLRV